MLHKLITLLTLLLLTATVSLAQDKMDVKDADSNLYRLEANGFVATRKLELNTTSE